MSKDKKIRIETMFGQSLSEITAHVALPEDYKAVKLEEIGKIFGVSSIRITAMQEVTHLGVDMIKVNEDDNLLFNKRENLSVIPTELSAASKKYIGDEELAYTACYHANRANEKKLEELIAGYNKTLLAMRSTIQVQEARIEEIRRNKEREDKL